MVVTEERKREINQKYKGKIIGSYENPEDFGRCAVCQVQLFRTNAAFMTLETPFTDRRTDLPAIFYSAMTSYWKLKEFDSFIQKSKVVCMPCSNAMKEILDSEPGDNAGKMTFELQKMGCSPTERDLDVICEQKNWKWYYVLYEMLRKTLHETVQRRKELEKRRKKAKKQKKAEK